MATLAENAKRPREIALKDIVQQTGVLHASPLADVVGQTLRIVGVEFHELPKYGKAVVVVTENGKRYYTFGQVVIKKLKAAMPYLDGSTIVAAKVVRRKRYIDLE